MARPRLLLPLSALAVLLAATVATGGHGSTPATTYNPSVEVEATTAEPNAVSGHRVIFGIPGGDVMSAGIVTFIPRDWGIIGGDAIPDGTRVGLVSGDITVGLVNGACNQQSPVVIDMYDSSLNQVETVSFEDTDDDFYPDFFENNISADLPDAVFLYPDFIPRIFDDGQQPLRRTAGVTILAGIPVLLQHLVFAPGTFINENIPNDPGLGFPSVVLLQNIGDPKVIQRPSPITDFCSPLLAVDTSFGVGAATPFFVNPQDGTYTFTVVSIGQPDADGDGYENTLDTCPYTPNLGNPRLYNGGDSDFDGLDAACDPNDDPATGGTKSDEDGDGFLNRQDNCPLVANGELDDQNQTESEPFGDGIGDLCDANPTEYDGQLLVDSREVEVVIGTGLGPGGRPTGCTDGTYECIPPEAAPKEPGPFAKGDVQCDGDVDAVDSLTILRWLAGLDIAQTSGCPDIGVAVSHAASSGVHEKWGDVDCDNDVDSVDALVLQRYLAALPVFLPDGCDAIGALPANRVSRFR